MLALRQTVWTRFLVAFGKRDATIGKWDDLSPPPSLQMYVLSGLLS